MCVYNIIASYHFWIKLAVYDWSIVTTNRQRRCLELIKDYNLQMHYHPGKANVVADALSRKSHCHPVQIEDSSLSRLMHPLVLHQIALESSLRNRVIKLQQTDVGIHHIKRRMKEEETKYFWVDEDRILWFNDRLVVPKNRELRNQILSEAHLSRLSIHPGSSKMY